MREIAFKDTSSMAELRDKVRLTHQVQEVVKCQESGVFMLNIDADELAPGDLPFIKGLGLTISNPHTEKPVALGVDFEEKTFGSRVSKWFESDDDDDSNFFYTPTGYTVPIFGGSSMGGFGGGFGGGSFGGGGASRSF